MYSLNGICTSWISVLWGIIPLVFRAFWGPGLLALKNAHSSTSCQAASDPSKSNSSGTTRLQPSKRKMAKQTPFLSSFYGCCAFPAMSSAITRSVSLEPNGSRSTSGISGAVICEPKIS